ncbi:helix-turn-helix domain-containing protein [Streptomyces jumonjinensis]|uniref:Helix-turn-helix domain-containing protein n=1 Tax=Streptomyces jumonjinensis TaxID=1945 RepID=A0A646KNK5_STRJU|nr:helix-turn-helix domain-containing protein [Streptomyces jumonjinensis]MQT03872.1 helix-turn-helix domain-containing protein [Streptomyces jumonjinensis]
MSGGLKKGDRPVTDEDRAAVRTLHAQGLGRNEIARQLGRGQRTVSRIAEDLGLTFDRTATAVATQARVSDAKARRAAIISGLYDVAEADLDYLRRAGPYELVEVSAGKAVAFRVGRLPAIDRRALLTGISTAITAATRLETVDGDPGTDAARSMLTSLADGIRRLADAHEEDTAEEG